jgi:hypothetical protein
MFGGSRSRPVLWKSAALGVVVGLIVAGFAALSTANEGPHGMMSPGSTIGNTSWIVADNNPWRASNGEPVVFWYASAACPYCDADSWALQLALEQFGQLGGALSTTSSPSDVYPGTPGVNLAGSFLFSNFISWDPKEDSNNIVLGTPSITPAERAYIGAYAGPVPFITFGGLYMHSGGLLSPSVFCSSGCNETIPGDPNYVAYSPSQVQEFLASGQGPVYNAIIAQACLLEAFFWKIDSLSGITPPSSVTELSAVASDFQSIPTP